LLGFTSSQGMEHLAKILITPVFGDRGAEVPFRIYWMANESLAWFGPLAFLLVFTALGFALVRGPRRLKITAVALTGYFYLLTLIPAWHPGNAHYFTPFFVCGGFCVAFLLPPWRFTTLQKKGLQCLAALMLGYALWGNVVRPAVAVSVVNDTSQKREFKIVKNQSETCWMNLLRGHVWEGDRCDEARRLFGDNRVEVISNLLPPKARVGLIVPDTGWSYPFLRENPGITFAFINPAEEGFDNRVASLALNYLLYLHFDSSFKLVGPEGSQLWVSDPHARIKGCLLKISSAITN